MKIRNTKIILLLIILNFLLNGCVTTIPLSDANKQMIHAVSIDNNVNVPKEMYFFGGGSQLAMFVPGGAIGGAITGAINASKGDSMQKLIEANHIYIDQIVKNQFEQQIKNNSNLKLVSQQNADAIFMINIKSYGFSISNGFSVKLKPVLSLQASLVKQNQIIWQDSYYIDPLASGMPSYRMHDLQQNPDLVYQAWNEAAQKAVTHIIKTL